MDNIFVFLAMCFFHIVDDYYLQGFLAQAKQVSWWKENYPDEMYKYDYICALLTHGFSWAFMVMLPVAFCFGFVVPQVFVVMLIVNGLSHCLVDHVKANMRLLNLSQDQFLHFLQIMWIYWYFFL